MQPSRNIIAPVMLLLLTAAGSAVARADVTNADLLGQIESLRQMVVAQNARITTLESRVSGAEVQTVKPPVPAQTINEFKQHIEQRLQNDKEGNYLVGGMKMMAGATFVGQQALNINRNAGKKGKDSNDVSYSVDLALEKKFKNCGRVFMHIENGDGIGADRELALFSRLNRDANDTDHVLKMTEVYYEHYLFSDQLGFKFGQLDPSIEMDENAIAFDETTQFLGHMFRNSPVIDLPENHVGGKAVIRPELVPWAELSGGYIDGDNNGDHYSSTGFMFGQTNLKPLFLGVDYPGNYRFYLWRNDANHTRWLDTSVTAEAGTGWGLSADQKVARGLTFFSRYGGQDENIYLLNTAWSAGAQVDGFLWNRGKDFAGIAFGQVHPGDNWRIQGDALDPAIGRNSYMESHLEIYYSYKLDDHFTITPDLQWIWNPYGMNTDPSSRTDLSDPATLTTDYSRSSAVVLGLRGQLDF
ncbi:MAG: carbohydrate porin [Candidatus Omnitrophota bacterium]|jgi:carbohydrate-selective porin OprB